MNEGCESAVVAEVDVRTEATTALRLSQHQEPAAVAPIANVPKAYSGKYYPVETRTPRGFSLLELLIVIGIIAVMFVLLLPAIHTARLEAQVTQCATQLRQIGHAL